MGEGKYREEKSRERVTQKPLKWLRKENGSFDRTMEVIMTQNERERERDLWEIFKWYK